jgi:hypothetical protein
VLRPALSAVAFVAVAVAVAVNDQVNDHDQVKEKMKWLPSVQTWST